MTHLRSLGFEPYRMSVDDYDMEAPLKAIRRLLLESQGLIIVALRRLWVERGEWKKGADVELTVKKSASDMWFTSPFCQIEPAMAYQLGLPILILRERGVVAEGLLEKSSSGIYMPEFSVDDDPGSYLKSAEAEARIKEWEGSIRSNLNDGGQEEN